MVKFSDGVHAQYNNLFGEGKLIKASAVKNCNDVNDDFQDNIPFSAQPYKIQSWSRDQLVFVKNDKYYGNDPGKVAQVVMVPKADTDTDSLRWYPASPTSSSRRRTPASRTR